MGKVLLITGAGGGLGSIVARAEARSFSEIILLGRTKATLEAAAVDARANTPGTAKIHCIVSDVSQRRSLEDALSPFDRLSGVVNAAGVLGPVRKIGDEQWQDWENAVMVNLVGTASVCSIAIPKLVGAGRGKIVNFAGGGSAGNRPFHTSYASSKAGVVRLTEILAAEHPQLDANVIAPGAHHTGIWKTETHDKPPAKWADRERFASLVSFLLSTKSDGISGKFIHINDKWEEFTPEVSKSEMFTLRRIEPPRQTG